MPDLEKVKQYQLNPKKISIARFLLEPRAFEERLVGQPLISLRVSLSKPCNLCSPSLVISKPTAK